MTCRFVVGIVEPPGVPQTRTFRFPTTAIDGHMADSILFPGATAFTVPWISP